MKRIITITFLLLMALVPTWAQKKDKPRTVNDAHGTFTYTAGPSESIAQAKQKCEALAQLNAIEKEFGKAISSVTDASTTVEGENVSSTFQENTNADVRGEWIETTRATEFKVEVVNDQFVVTADVWGTIREITEAKADITYRIYNFNNIETREFQQTKDRKTSRIYMDFQAPATGHLVVYLLDQTDNKAYQMLPYRDDERSSFPVKKGETYTLFNPRTDPAAKTLNLTTKKEADYFQLCILFSPNPIASNFDTKGRKNQLNSMNLPSFREWLAKARNADRSLVQKTENITIYNKTIQNQ